MGSATRRSRSKPTLIGVRWASAASSAIAWRGLGLPHLAFVRREEASSHRSFVEAFPRRPGQQLPARR
jgi:hypothetical protein